MHSFDMTGSAFAWSTVPASMPILEAKLKKTVLLLAGPIAGCASLWIIGNALDRLAVRCPANKKIGLCALFCYKLLINNIMAEEVMYGFTPFNTYDGGDGRRLWAWLPKKFLDRCIHPTMQLLMFVVTAAMLSQKDNVALTKFLDSISAQRLSQRTHGVLIPQSA